MYPYKQLYHHDPDNGIYGDCGRTVVACLLNRPPDTVPHFWDSNNPNGCQECLAWLRTRGYEYVYYPVRARTKEDVLNNIGYSNGNFYYILLGTSRTGCNHVVICKGNQIIHDPSKDNAWIIGPADDGYFWIEFIVRQ